MTPDLSNATCHVCGRDVAVIPTSNPPRLASHWSGGSYVSCPGSRKPVTQGETR